MTAVKSRAASGPPVAAHTTDTIHPPRAASATPVAADTVHPPHAASATPVAVDNTDTVQPSRSVS